MFKAREVYGFKPKGEWFKIQNFKAQDKRVAEIQIYDVIGEFEDAISAKQLVTEIKGLDVDEIRVSINSPGGSVFSGLAISNALRSHPANVVTVVEGIAASIASVIWASGDQRLMHESSMLMIHSAWALVIGNARELRDMAATLDKIDGQLVAFFDRIFDKTRDEIETMFSAETWLTAQEVSDMGGGEIIDDPDVKAELHFDLSVFRNAPKTLLDRTKLEPEAQADKEVSEEDTVSQKDVELLKARLRMAEAHIA